MKIPEIKRLVETYSIDELTLAEGALLEENLPAIEINGVDEGEKLTHTLAAIWILEKMASDKITFPEALRAYTSKVRTSIS